MVAATEIRTKVINQLLAIKDAYKALPY